MSEADHWAPPFDAGARGFAHVSDLKPHPKNREIYADRENDTLVDRIERHGFKESQRLLVCSDGTILSGHRRWDAAKRVGLDRVPVEVSDADPDSDEALLELLTANDYRDKTPGEKVNEAELRLELKKRQGKEKQGQRTDLSQNSEKGSDSHDSWEEAAQEAGFSRDSFSKGKKVKEKAEEGDETAQQQWEQLESGEQSIHGAYTEVKDAEKKEQQKLVDETVSEEPQTPDLPDVESGDVWELGDHLLYCGDTSQSGDTDLTDGFSEAAFAFADPPYNAEAAPWDHGFGWEHDFLSEAADVVAVTPGIGNIPNFYQATDMPYKWSVSAWIDNGMTRGGLGFGNWIYVAIFSSDSVHANSQDMARVSVKTSESGETDHKGRKPSELMSWLFERFTDPGDTVVDPFLGSGTTLLTAEAEDRICVGGEKNPEFCAEIIARWESQTGEDAAMVDTHQGGGSR